jgi:hypothetical protein
LAVEGEGGGELRSTVSRSAGFSPWEDNEIRNKSLDINNLPSFQGSLSAAKDNGT